MKPEDAKYALAKQIDRIEWIETNSGQLFLTEQMKDAVRKVLKPLLEKEARDSHSASHS